MVFWCFQGGTNYGCWSYIGQSMMISFGWWCSQFVPSGRMLQKKQIYISNKREDTSSKKIASTEKDEKVLYFVFVSLCSLFCSFFWFSFILNLRLLQKRFLKILYDRTLPPCRVCALEVENDDKSVQYDLCDIWI